MCGIRDTTYNIRQLRLGDQVLRLGPDQLLLQHGQFGALGLLVLEPGDLFRDLPLVLAAGVDALLRVPDGLEQAARVVEGVGVRVLLLAELRDDDAHFVADVADGLVARLLAPLRQLRGDADALLARRLVGRDQVVVRLDELVQPARQLGLDGTPQGRQREPMAGTTGVAGAAAGVLLGADRV